MRAIRGVPKNDDEVNSEIHSEAVNEGVCKSNWRSSLSELRDVVGGRDRVSLEMQLEAEVE